jgi:hypothetical protein
VDPFIGSKERLLISDGKYADQQTAFLGGTGGTTDDALDGGTLQELRGDAGLGDGGVVQREVVPGETDRRGSPQPELDLAPALDERRCPGSRMAGCQWVCRRRQQRTRRRRRAPATTPGTRPHARMPSQRARPP